MNGSPLSRLLQFTHLLNELQKVNRIIYIPGTTIRENDVEHSFQLAMLAWYIADVHSLPFNKEHILKYALAHDLVEAYAGDTFLYSKNQEELDSKFIREEEARMRIEKEFPECKEIHEAITSYMRREDEESRFVYVVDKLQPVFQLYLDNGTTWKEEGITLQMLVDKKKDKVAVSAHMQPYWDELLELLQQNEARLFQTGK